LKAELIMGSLRNPTIVTIFRPRLILGAGRTGTITQLHKWIGTGFPVPIIGSGKNRYQFIAVGDVVSAIHKSLELRTSGVFNLGSDNPPRIEELIPLVIEKIKRKNLLIKLPARSTKTLLTFLDWLNVSPLVPEQFLIADQDFVLNTSKFKNYTGWKPERGDGEMLVEALLALDEIK
jgi:dTDP-glucose 4,6-dehydratase